MAVPAQTVKIKNTVPAWIVIKLIILSAVGGFSDSFEYFTIKSSIRSSL